MGVLDIGSVIASLGVKSGDDLADTDLVTDCVVLLRLQTDEGAVLKVRWSEGMDWMVRRGMVEAARDAERTCNHEADQTP